MGRAGGLVPRGGRRSGELCPPQPGRAAERGQLERGGGAALRPRAHQPRPRRGRVAPARLGRRSGARRGATRAGHGGPRLHCPLGDGWIGAGAALHGGRRGPPRAGERRLLLRRPGASAGGGAALRSGRAREAPRRLAVRAPPGGRSPEEPLGSAALPGRRGARQAARRAPALHGAGARRGVRGVRGARLGAEAPRIVARRRGGARTGGVRRGRREAAAPAEAPLGRGVERDLHLPGAGARRGLLSSWLQDPVAGAGGGTAFRDRRAPRRGGPLRDQHLGALPRRGGAVAYREPPDRAGGVRGESWGESGTSPRGVGAFRGTFGPPGAHAGARARRVPSHPPVSVHEEHTMAAKKASSATARAATPRATSTTKPASGRRASARPAGNAVESARGKSKASSAARAARSSAPSKQASIKASATTGAAKKAAKTTTKKALAK